MIKRLADILKRNTRDEDLVARWGGEEFVLVLYGADLQRSYEVLQRVQTELRDHSIPPIGWPLTLSAGLLGGGVPESEGALKGWITTADKALYRAKQGGRDRVEIV